MKGHKMKYNQEGYYDPTPYEALKKIEYRPLVYICSPFAGDTKKNIQNARSYCKFAVARRVIPIAPHLLFPQFMDDDNPADRKLGLFFARVLLDKCSQVWVFGDKRSAGMKLELDRAKSRKMQIRYFDEACEEISQGKR
jgi:hypothetical protein